MDWTDALDSGEGISETERVAVSRVEGEGLPLISTVADILEAFLFTQCFMGIIFVTLPCELHTATLLKTRSLRFRDVDKGHISSMEDLNSNPDLLVTKSMFSIAAVHQISFLTTQNWGKTQLCHKEFTALSLFF